MLIEPLWLLQESVKMVIANSLVQRLQIAKMNYFGLDHLAI